MRQLEERTGQFKVGGIIAMNDPRSDITLMPDFPGMTDSENCADWDTGFPMDLDAIRDKDEDYWDTYKGTPKAYISLATGQEIWNNRFGSLTAVRYAQNGSEAQEALAALRAELEKRARDAAQKAAAEHKAAAAAALLGLSLIHI